ncbi:hypothetical protein H6771_02020 [Candidatus Peribacteria bacterium]|nr:hypothetical protein [Candidatus Peribacteria bacterium]
MHILLLHISGKETERTLTREALSEELQVALRDLRPVFTPKQMITLLPRGESIIANLLHVKLIITPLQVYIFQSKSRKIQEEFLPVIRNAVHADAEHSCFHFRMLDAALTYALQTMAQLFRPLEEQAEQILHSLSSAASETDLNQLLLIKKKLQKISTTITVAEELLEETLESPDTLEALTLTPDTTADEPELTSILENAFEQIEQLSHEIEDITESIDDTQEILTLQLSARRNTIIRIDLLISLLSGIFAFLAVIVGLYGVNLKNHLETSPLAFALLSMGLFMCFVLALLGGVYYLKRKRIL